MTLFPRGSQWIISVLWNTPWKMMGHKREMRAETWKSNLVDCPKPCVTVIPMHSFKIHWALTTASTVLGSGETDSNNKHITANCNSGWWASAMIEECSDWCGNVAKEHPPPPGALRPAALSPVMPRALLDSMHRAGAFGAWSSNPSHFHSRELL